MDDKNSIFQFAVKWRNKFKDQSISCRELEAHDLADDCAALGFVMDSGQAFGQRYGAAAYNSEELDKIIGEVTDISLLGSAIYSRWRYFNHWAGEGDDISSPPNRAWFISALSRLAFLACENECNPFSLRDERTYKQEDNKR